MTSCDHIPKIRDEAFRLLSLRSRSIDEVRGRLQKKGFRHEEIEKVLDELQEKGYLNDRQFAEEFARHLRIVKGYGIFRVKGELRKKGIEERTIAEVLGKTNIEEDDFSRARESMRNYLKKSSRDDKLPVPREKLARYLYRMGFSGDLICEMLREDEEKVIKNRRQSVE